MAEDGGVEPHPISENLVFKASRRTNPAASSSVFGSGTWIWTKDGKGLWDLAGDRTLPAIIVGVSPGSRTPALSFGDWCATVTLERLVVWSGYRESNSDVLLGKQSGYLYIIPALCGTQSKIWTCGLTLIKRVLYHWAIRVYCGLQCKNRTCASCSQSTGDTISLIGGKTY